MTTTVDLQDLGWDETFETQLIELGPPIDDTVGRVVKEHRGAYSVATTAGETRAGLSGRFRHEAIERADLPAVGDWVVLRTTPDGSLTQVEHVLPRRSKFSRKVAGLETGEQVMATNVDFIFVVASLNAELNLRRIERYLTVAWSSGASPIVVLTKSDLCSAIDSAMADVAAVATGAPVYAVSNVTGAGIEELRAYMSRGRTTVLLGSSGVGKSSLVNRLAGKELMITKDIREDDKGRHTTSHRELIVLPGGGIVIDTPGLRELQLWDEPDGLDDAFEDIAEIAVGCRFNDCKHSGEPGCAIAAALEDGTLTHERYASYAKLQRELRSIAVRRDKRAAHEAKRRFTAMTRQRRNRKAGWM